MGTYNYIQPPLKNRASSLITRHQSSKWKGIKQAASWVTTRVRGASVVALSDYEMMENLSFCPSASKEGSRLLEMFTKAKVTRPGPLRKGLEFLVALVVHNKVSCKWIL